MWAQNREGRGKYTEKLSTTFRLFCSFLVSVWHITHLSKARKLGKFYLGWASSHTTSTTAHRVKLNVNGTRHWKMVNELGSKNFLQSEQTFPTFSFFFTMREKKKKLWISSELELLFNWLPKWFYSICNLHNLHTTRNSTLRDKVSLLAHPTKQNFKLVWELSAAAELTTIDTHCENYICSMNFLHQRHVAIDYFIFVQSRTCVGGNWVIEAHKLSLSFFAIPSQRRMFEILEKLVRGRWKVKIISLTSLACFLHISS